MAAGFFLWKREVEQHGLEAVRRISGYHDEPLHGKLRGIRSVRLALAYRAYYRLVGDRAQIVVVEEVNKHDHKAIERLFRR